MPNINISDARQRDAVVKAESTRQNRVVFYQDNKGLPAYTRKVLKGAVHQDYESMLEQFSSNEALAKALVEGDPEIDFERDGMFLWGTSRVYINPDEELVYRIRTEEVVYNPDGSIRERREQRLLEANIDAEIPLTWTGKLIAKSDAIRQFVFATKLQIVHINGLTYDFLYEMAKELHESKSLMVLGGGAKGKDPLIFRSRSLPYRGFLEGRIDGDKYILLLHLSNLELKKPQVKTESRETKPETESKTKTKSKGKASESKSETKSKSKAKSKTKSKDKATESKSKAKPKSKNKATKSKSKSKTKTTELKSETKSKTKTKPKSKPSKAKAKKTKIKGKKNA